MDFIEDIMEVMKYLDKYLAILVGLLGYKIYIIMFVIVFMESAFIVTPFLPGNSLLFIAGSLACVGEINIFILVAALTIASTLGGLINYGISMTLGNKLLNWSFFKKIIKDGYISKTKEFYDSKGGKMLILSKFVPVVRTFSPFLAGLSKMNFFKFSLYNVASSLIWIVAVSFLGYLFGNVDIVRYNYSTAMLIIFCIYILAGIINFVIKRFKKNKLKKQ
ncbi:membrane-associated protein [Hathewaya proteolytica DSM 3090]|uniref:Membrane-associated protein n=1 Tax=Hathewaya proteolytica DSM 3090 TaxID=1121331 RepID=A0A1M6LZ91_9CLOT|nr:VTT domain-containing protein [Hathewaya proteolytica]SHJ76515.1 membrane-associated protein [Hathewaya proteolytica DSM 3090]